VALRPEKIRLLMPGPGGTTPSDAGLARLPNQVEGEIEAIVYLGAHTTYHVRLAAGALLQVTVATGADGGPGALERGATVRLAWSPESQVVLPE
jgi:putrescine transport system ATP-binding protein